jgi:DNA-binding transcriptional MerR regulator/quercetin dioxygenase-like cupin family protein
MSVALEYATPVPRNRTEPQLVYRVSDAARALGISPATLRLWERQGLITPSRTRGKSRRYTHSDLSLLRRIQFMRRVERLSPLAIARILREHRSPDEVPAPEVANSMSPGMGERLRNTRRRAGLTLPQVAEQVGLSVSFISAVERGVSGISISALHALVKVYGKTIQDLFVEAESPGALVRANERPTLPSPSGVRLEQLAVGTLQMEPQLVTVEPGCGSEGAYDHVGEEFVFVLQGEMDLWLGERKHHLFTGDCLYFASTIPHRWRNPGKQTARTLWVNTPPTF